MSRLSEALLEVEAAAGTLHRRDGDVLRLADAVNIPPTVVDVIDHIPAGRGMAGMAWETGQPVTTCNLPEDPSGVIRPGARAVNAKAAIAIPVRDVRDDVYAVVGFAFGDERTLTNEDLTRLTQLAERVATGQAGSET